MSKESLTDLSNRLAARRASLRQATDAAARQALRKDIAAIERLLVSRLEPAGNVIEMAAYKKLTKSA
ncbi:MAG: hypothetical protein ACYCZX_17785 [Rhodospirillaceae bacterium]